MNRYDDFRPDVPALLKSQETALTPPDPAARSGDRLGIFGRLASLAALYGLGALVGSGIHRRLVYANLRLGWLADFQRYWSTELGNRPLQPHDFYFLYGVYRQRLQSIEERGGVNFTPGVVADFHGVALSWARGMSLNGLLRRIDSETIQILDVSGLRALQLGKRRSPTFPLKEKRRSGART